MTGGPEAGLEGFLYSRVRAAGGMAVKLVPVKRGFPDRLILWPGGRAYLVELKVDDGRPSPIQDHWHARAAEIGHPVVVLRGRGEILRWLRERAAEEDEPGRAPLGPKARRRCDDCGRDILVRVTGELRRHVCRE